MPHSYILGTDLMPQFPPRKQILGFLSSSLTLIYDLPFPPRECCFSVNPQWQPLLFLTVRHILPTDESITFSFHQTDVVEWSLLLLRPHPAVKLPPSLLTIQMVVGPGQVEPIAEADLSLLQQPTLLRASDNVHPEG